jgi:oligosaccharide reducing-end xylanase
LSDGIQAFFWQQGISSYGALYELDGKRFSGPNIESAASPPTGLVATNAVASLAATNPHAKDFVQALWDAPIPSGQMRYYDGLLYLMSLLHCGGEFRLWKPKL